jgi:transcriptional regulator with XRE-family HTH domain
MTDFYGNNLDYYLKKRKMTAQQLADESGVSTSAISRYLSGEREPDDVGDRLAAALDCTVRDLFPRLRGHDSVAESSGD